MVELSNKFCSRDIDKAVRCNEAKKYNQNNTFCSDYWENTKRDKSTLLKILNFTSEDTKFYF